MKRTRLSTGVGLLALAAFALAGRSAHAQWGYGYGYGGWGYGGYGGIGAMGMSLYDQEMLKSQMYMQGAAQYNMMNAQAVQNYASANLMQQQAISTALQNEKLSSQLAQDKYNLYSQAKNKAMADARASAPRIPLKSLIGSDGSVHWPEVAPSGGAHAQRRAAADEAIRTAYGEFAQEGHADVASVVDAKRRLHTYGEPALTLLRSRGDTRGRSQLLTFLQALEAALDAMGNPPEDAAPAADNAAPPPPPPGRRAR